MNLTLIRQFTACGVWLLLCAGNSPADVVTLKNGDRITGTVVKKGDEVLKFKTGYAGEIEIKWSEVGHLSLDEPTEAVLDDESLVTITEVGAPAAGRGPDANGGIADSIPLDEVETIKPEPWELGTAGKFTGLANLSTQLEKGNSDKDEIDFDFKMTYRKGDHRFNAKGQLEYDRTGGITSKQDWLALAKYDYFFHENTYFSFTYGAKQEKFAGLNLRQFAGPGIGHQFYEGKPTSALSEIGVFAVGEDFVEQADSTYWGPAWRLDFEHDFLDGKLTFYHDNYAVLSAEDTDKYLWHSWTGLRFPIVDKIVGSLEFEVDYDSQPALEAEKADTTIRLKLGYEW